MRVTLMLSSSAFSGAESVVYYLLKNMAKNSDIELQLIVNQEIVNYYNHLGNENNIEIFCYGPHNLEFHSSIMKGLDKVLRLSRRYKKIFKINKPHLKHKYKDRIINAISEFNPDFVHVHMYRTLETYLLVHNFLKNNHIKSCYTWHGDKMNRYKKYIIENDFFDIYTAVSYDAKMCWQSYFSKEIHTIYNGVDMNIDRLKDINYGDQERLKILFPAGQRRNKGYDYVLRLNHFLLEAYPNFQIRICGGSKLKYIDNIRYLGYMNHEKYLDEVARCDILVRPAKDDTFAISILEAHALNKEIICSNLPVYKEVYGEPKNIHYVDLNQDKFNKQVLNIIKRIEKEDRKEFSVNERLLSEFSWDEIANKYINLYIDYFKI